ncbi:hypothetical protein RRG08_006904 [Elysia crispata]|uniref:Uncharacterized protein n=1 Tax=Elysia crispata TaxID=231223 RepID=A0AAE0XSD2_9GAST|nr:hypothetical protein RRG08_006904 [Elysia crispata]
MSETGLEPTSVRGRLHNLPCRYKNGICPTQVLDRSKRSPCVTVGELRGERTWYVQHELPDPLAGHVDTFLGITTYDNRECCKYNTTYLIHWLVMWTHFSVQHELPDPLARHVETFLGFSTYDDRGHFRYNTGNLIHWLVMWRRF